MRTVQWEDTVPFVPPITEGTVIKVYDGDTLTVASTLPDQTEPLYRFSVRLAGIDTPELRSRDDGERALAVAARDVLAARVLHKRVRLENVDNDKYGRLLARVVCDGECVNDTMLTLGHAVPYNGGAKPSWSASR